MPVSVLDKALLKVSTALIPLTAIDSAAKATDLLKKLGYQLPGNQEFTGIPASLISKVGAIAGEIQELAESETGDDRLTAMLQLASKVKDIAADIAEMVPKMQSTGAATASFFTQAPVSELPRRLLDYLIADYLETYYAGTYYFLLLVGITDEIETQANPAIFQPAYTLRKIHYDRLPKYVTEPTGLSEEVYQWQTNFNSELFLVRLDKMLRGLVLPGGLYKQNTQTRSGLSNANAITREVRIPVFEAGNTPELYSQFGVAISGVEATAGKPKGLALVPYTLGVGSVPFDLNEEYDIVLEVSAGIDNGIGIVLRPPLNLEFINNLFTTPGSVGEFTIKVSLKKKVEKDAETVIFGSAATSYLSIKGIEFSVFFSKKQSDVDFGFEFDIKQGKVIIGTEGADGFIEKILAGIHLDIDFGVRVGFTAKEGFHFRGSGGLEIQLPLHLSLGPLQIGNLVLRLQPQDGVFPLIATTTVGVNLGPLDAVVENIGIKLAVGFPSGGGNLGPANFELGFKPPNGLGLSINAGAVIGGGYLRFDPEKQQYDGILELTIAGFISAKAIGLITTQMPDGSSGFSMLIIITAEFMPPFQLGYGFTLIGVGGLLGLHRTVLLDPLRDGVRTGAVNNILFPSNVIANAPRIISDLKTIFPPYEGKFLIGPMAKMGWGTPTLISVSFGLIIEIPGNIAILGVLKVILPDEAVPIVKIQVAFLGAIDFDRKMLSFDASLFESSVLGMTLEGDMAARLSWGDQPVFILSVGGFHPSFTPPPIPLPSLRRLSINILNKSDATIRVACYFAVTSNTVQFGARADIWFKLSACTIEGDIGFDALFQFNPFYFIIDVTAGFGLKVSGRGLMTVRVSMSLEGPTPWHAKGTGKISLLFFSISANFDKTWGEQRNTSLPAIAILPGFLEEIRNKAHWSTKLSTGKHLLVSLRNTDETPEDVLLLHPAGSLMVLQKLVPLDIDIQKIGNQKVSDVKQLHIESAFSGGTPLNISPVSENFARAQYQDMSKTEKLSSPSFEKLKGGVEISMGRAVRNGRMVRRKVEYEVTIVDKEPVKPSDNAGRWKERAGLFNHFLKGSNLSKSRLSQSYRQKLQPFAEMVQVNEETFSVAYQENNSIFSPEAVFESEAQARTFMRQQIRENPGLKTQVHIVSPFELQET